VGTLDSGPPGVESTQMLRLWLIKLMPFMARWQDTAPAACCGMCGPCLTATATGLSLEMVGVRKSDAAPNGPADD
jgi:hypothetical protein